MTTRDAEFSPRLYARIAGFLYLIVIVGGAFAELFVRQRLMIANDAAATAGNILAHEQLFRWGFVAQLVPLLCSLFLAVIFYELFAVVSRRVASLVVFSTLVGNAVEAAGLLNHLAPLILLKRGHALGVDPQLLQAQAYITLNLQSIGFAVALSFFGITCLALGYLIYRSGFLPRIIGLLLAIEGACYLTNSFGLFLAPAFAARFFSFLLVSGTAEVVLCLWLLLRGLNVAKWRERGRAVLNAAEPGLTAAR